LYRFTNQIVIAIRLHRVLLMRLTPLILASKSRVFRAATRNFEMSICCVLLRVDSNVSITMLR